MAFDTFVLPDGQTVGTGLKIPLSTASQFKDYATVGPMLSMNDVIAIAKSRPRMGRKHFDKTFIKNQRSHGSCQGFMSAAMLTRARIRRGHERVDLSGAYAYSKVNGGRDSGSMLEDGMESSMRDGICREALANWDQIYPSRYDKAACDADAQNFKGFECYAVRSELELFSAVALNFDVGVAVHADNGFMRLDSRGVAQGGNGPGNHAVAGDDLYWDGELILAAYNSWDVSYGDEGRMGLTWSQHFRHTNNYHVYYAIRSTTDPKKDDGFPVANV